MKAINGRSLLVFLTLVIGTVIGSSQTPKAASSESPFPVNRYQIVNNPNVRAGTFLLDTVTGRVWQLTGFSDLDGDPDAWLIKDRIDNDAQLAAWVSRHQPKKTAEK